MSDINIQKSVKIKPYYSKNGAILYKADCLEIMDSIPENSVDMIFADPPYNLSNGGFTVHSGKRVSVNKGKWDEEYVYILNDWFRNEKYRDVLDYIISVDCKYYFEYLPLHKIGLPVEA